MWFDEVVLGQLAHFEAILRAITYQQLSGKVAQTIYRRFNALFDGAGPSPGALTLLSDENLRAAGLSGIWRPPTEAAMSRCALIPCCCPMEHPLLSRLPRPIFNFGR